MPAQWFYVDVSVVLKDEAEWVARHGAEFTARVRAMPWRNIRFTLQYDVEAEVWAGSALEAQQAFERGVERCLPDGGAGLVWFGQNRPWR